MSPSSFRHEVWRSFVGSWRYDASVMMYSEASFSLRLNMLQCISPGLRLIRIPAASLPLSSLASPLQHHNLSIYQQRWTKPDMEKSEQKHVSLNVFWEFSVAFGGFRSPPALSDSQHQKPNHLCEIQQLHDVSRKTINS
ncbi:uncharacterized protein V6R79_014322 [Siganus canaliculatus]